MDKLHVRNIFSLILPLRAEETPHVDLQTSSSNFGFTLTYPSNSSSVSYRLNLYSDSRSEGQRQKTEGSFTSLLQWAKKNAISFKKYDNNTIEALILKLRIGPGFDFRKVPNRFIRFGIECFVSGTYQCHGSSKVCKLLGKRRTATSSNVEEGTPNIFTNFWIWNQKNSKIKIIVFN